MKKIIASIILSASLASLTYAQEGQFKLSKKTGTLNLNISGVSVEGYDGSEIIFSAPVLAVKDERAAGLKLISGSGLTDNTGINLSVRERAGNIDVDYVGKQEGGPITVKVPNTMSLKVITTGTVNSDGAVEVKDFKGELEISTMYNMISLENITGPVNAKTIYGELNAKFVSGVKGPVSLVSLFTHVDVTIPASLKANVNLSTLDGNIYAADGLDIARATPKQEKKSDEQDGTELKIGGGSTDIKGTLNGGGVDLILKTTYGKIYLRKN